MSTIDEPVFSPVSPAKAWALVLAALVAALLGLTLVEPVPHPGLARSVGADPTSADCIVASAVFAGVHRTTMR